MLAVIVGALVSYSGSGRIYDGVWAAATSSSMASPRPDRPRQPARRAEAQEEIRQMLEAKSARREARGEAPLDVDAEMAALTSPPAAARDPALREEVRQLVVARNERRAAPGQRSRSTWRRRSSASCAISGRELASPIGYRIRAMARRSPLSSSTTCSSARGRYFNPQTEVHGRGGRLPLDGRRDLQHGGVRGRRLGADRGRRAGRRGAPRRDCSRPSRPPTTAATAALAAPSQTTSTSVSTRRPTTTKRTRSPSSATWRTTSSD